MTGKHKHSSQHFRHRQRYHYLGIAKKERRHAEANMRKMEESGNDYSVLVYRVRIKALDLYIKHLQNTKQACENF